ncbi:MAG: amylo-alpha-1,6-glucosidase [Bacteroidales bacterium]
MNIQNKHGLSVDFLENGTIRSIHVTPISIGVRDATSFSKSWTNLYLRKKSDRIEYTALIGPESNSSFTISGDAYIAKGKWEGLEYTCVLQLSAKSHSWLWSAEIKNTGDEQADIDLFLVQEAGLKPITTGINNELYVSQYLERRILNDPRYGSVICCRQNMKESLGNPWLMMACKNGAPAASVDGMQFYGRSYRETGIPEGLLAEKPAGEYAGESTVLVLQGSPAKLAAGKNHSYVFISAYLPDHPHATSENDLKRLPELITEFDDALPVLPSGELILPEKNLFQTSGFLPVDDLSEAETTHFFGTERRHAEKQKDSLLSFFCGANNHVVLRAKEVLADRSHAHIMQARTGYAPDESVVSTTAFAFGVFNSHITQGNTNFNILLSVCSSPFNLATETGQRIFVELEGKTYLLGVPSAFEMGLNHCRWIYKHGKNTLQVRSWTSKKADQVNLDLSVLQGNKVKLWLTHHFDHANGWKIFPGSRKEEFVIKPKAESMIAEKFPKAQFRMIIQAVNGEFSTGGDELLYEDGKNHSSDLFVIAVRETSSFSLSILGEVCSAANPVLFDKADPAFQSDCRDAQTALNDLCLNLSLAGEQEDVRAIREILPWYGMNALTHFLTPYGLEQFSGAAWGTRDVSQGPFDLLLNLGKYDVARQVLRILFSNQNTDGGWPQWWMFDSYTTIRADHSHGDVFYWCLIALANYIKITGDREILGEVLPYFHEQGAAYAEKTPLSEHVDRLIQMIVDSFIQGTSLVPFGGGDWNDSLQPVSKELAQRMISSWTVEMNYQAFDQFHQIYEQTGNREKSQLLKDTCEKIKADFNRYLVRDGVVAGYGLVEKDGSISLLLHPTDPKTNIQYSLLPMNRGIISGIFTKEQAEHHMEIVEKHLKGPDGARLMNRPLKYQGGIQTIFQRAESSTFFGREIGLMYVHEHIRYAEAQALLGRPEAFVNALRQAIPVGYREIVPCGDIRQANCYYSSSDVAFRSRYEADELYDEIKTGKLTLRGGWRVYSSGPGIYIGLIISRLLGLRIESGIVILDPVIPKSMDGLSVSLDFLGRPVQIRYRIREKGFGPEAIYVNGKEIRFTREENKYRKGGAVIARKEMVGWLREKENNIEIIL